MAGWGGDRMGRRRSRPGVGALVASLALHAAAAAAAWAGGLAPRAPLPAFKVYKVDIVSPPPREAGPPRPAETGAPKVAKPEAKAEPKPAPERAPKPQVREQPRPQANAERTRATAAKEPPAEEKPASNPTGPRPDPDATTAGEGIDVRIEGEEFPFPGYLENIQLQIARYFRWNGASGLEAEVYFVIRKDGTISDIRLVRGSGDVSFNFEAMAAIEQAGRRGAFGSLPEGFTGERLPVLFYFRPAR